MVKLSELQGQVDTLQHEHEELTKTITALKETKDKMNGEISSLGWDKAEAEKLIQKAKELQATQNSE